MQVRVGRLLGEDGQGVVVGKDALRSRAQDLLFSASHGGYLHGLGLESAADVADVR